MTNPVQTLTKSVTVNDNPFMKPVEWLSLFLLAGVILVVLPLMLDGFRLNLVGKYLTYAFVALGLVICWGYAGILSLGQGVFFGLGGYLMAMYLKLEASSVENTKIQSTPGIPDFMDWNQITELPWFWHPFQSLPLTLLDEPTGGLDAGSTRCLWRTLAEVAQEGGRAVIVASGECIDGVPLAATITLPLAG